jgi:hypothetical protein
MILFEIMLDLPLYLCFIVCVANNLILAWNLLCLKLRITLI